MDGQDLAEGAVVEPGGAISYRVTAENTSGVPVTGVRLVDDLTDVLDEATFVAGSAALTIGTSAPIAVPDRADTTLQTAPFTLPANQSAVLSYTVVVDDDAWAATLTNLVSGSGSEPPATCATQGSQDPECSTTQVTPSPVQVLKVGENAAGQVVPMDVSSWRVWDQRENGSVVLEDIPAAMNGGVAVTGLFRTTNLAPGVYWLKESRALPGFQLLAQRVRFVIRDDGTVRLGNEDNKGSGNTDNISVITDAPGAEGIPTIRVEDVPMLELPEAGGSGALPWHLVGTSILAVGVLGVLMVRIAQRRGDAIRPPS